MTAEQMARLTAEFQRDGYVIARRFLDSQQIRQLLDQIDRYLQQLPALPPEAAFYEDKSNPESLKRLDQLSKDDYFRNLLDHGPWVALVEQLLGQPIIPQSVALFGNPPLIGLDTPPHQDGEYYLIEPNEAAMVWLALDEVDEGNGCVRYIPGSHRQGLREHAISGTLGFSLGVVGYGPDAVAREVPTCMAPGDIIVHHSLTIHRADGNRSQRRRWGLGCEYRGKHVKEDAARRQAHVERMKQVWADEARI